MNCSYSIPIANVNSIRIVFQHFETEYYEDKLYFGIGDAPDENAAANAIGSIDGTPMVTPPPISFQSPSLWFLFMTNEDVTYSGFEISWEAFDGEFINYLRFIITHKICILKTNDINYFVLFIYSFI